MYEVAYQHMGSDDVEELLARARAGDDASLSYLVGNNIPFMLKIIAAKSGALNRYDVFHEVIEHVMTYVDRYDSKRGSFSNWIKNLIEFGTRKRSEYFNNAYKKRMIVEGHATIMASLAPSPRDIIMSKEYNKVRRAALNKAKSSLSLRDRWIVFQHFTKGRSLTDIALEDKVTQQAIHQRLKVVLGIMRGEMEVYAEALGRA